MFPSTASSASYFYPRPPRGGRPAYTVAAFPAIFISIHALREEGDQMGGLKADYPALFLSTPSARRATFSLTAQKRF